jgi:hypothetical protein
MTLDLAVGILKKGQPKTHAFTLLSEAYANYTPGEIAECIAYIRAQLTLDELDLDLTAAEQELEQSKAKLVAAKKSRQTE